MQKYDLQPDPHNSQNFMFERGNVLGVSVPNLNDWVDQTLQNGTPSLNGQKQAPAKSCVIKLYDKNINAFKLNEQISFIGILEF